MTRVLLNGLNALVEQEDLRPQYGFFHNLDPYQEMGSLLDKTHPQPFHNSKGLLATNILTSPSPIIDNGLYYCLLILVII